MGGNDAAITITIPGFKRWQKQTERRRDWIALDTGFFSDPKVCEVLATLPDALNCYLWLLMNADLETEGLTIRLSILKRQWMNATGNESNRFDVLKRVQCLSNAGLIAFQLHSNDVLMAVQCKSNTPLESPQTQALTGPLQTDNTDRHPPTPQRGESEAVRFEEFWNLYPKKKSKPDALRAWKRHKLDSAFDAIITGLNTYKASSDWLKNGGQFIPYPATFLNQRRWEDEIATTQGPASITPPPGEFLKGYRLLRHKVTSYEVTPEQCRPDPESPQLHILTKYGRYRLDEFDLVPALEVVANAS